MKIWLSKNSEIPVREQLVTQIILGIAGGDLPVGERLPSTNELARRFQIHPNTVSNAYQSLCDRGWLEFKKGSGFYVCDAPDGHFENSLDKLIAQFIQTAKKQGFSLSDIKTRLTHFLESEPPEQLLVIESDLELQKILVEEISQATGFRVSGVSFEDFKQNGASTDAILTAMFDERTKLQPVLAPDKTCIFLKTNSVAGSMKSEDRPGAEHLIAIVSGWKEFLVLAKILLIATKIDAESLIMRNTHEKNWDKGLQNASIIICDILTSQYFPNNKKIRPFRLISENSLNELREVFNVGNSR